MYQDHLSGHYSYFVLIPKTRRLGLSGSGMFPEGGTVLIYCYLQLIKYYRVSYFHQVLFCSDY